MTRPPARTAMISLQSDLTNRGFGLAHLLRDESGQDLIEYALLAALIGLGATTAVKGLGTKIASAFTTVSSNLTSNT